MEWLHPLSRDVALSPEGRFYPSGQCLSLSQSPGAAALLPWELEQQEHLAVL